MSNTIRIKRRAQGGGAGAPTTMANGELAMNEHNDVLWYGEGTGGAGGTATQAIPVGGSGAFVALSGDQTSIAGEKTFTNLLTAANGLKVGTTPVFPASAGQLIADSIVVNTGTLQFLNNATISVPTPTQNSHAVTKAYVDSIAAGGVVWLESAKVATVGNITLSGTQTIDGATLSVADRVLVKDQTTASENGVYVVASGAWTRATDFDTVSSSEISAGKSIFVGKGDVNGGTSWVLSTAGTITLGTTPLIWTQIGGGQSETGKNVGNEGVGLFVGKVGTELEIRKLTSDTGSGITVSAPTDKGGTVVIDIPTSIPLAKGGTGATTASAARDNLGLGSASILSADSVVQTSGQQTITGQKTLTATTSFRDMLMVTNAGADLQAGYTVIAYSGAYAVGGKFQQDLAPDGATDLVPLGYLNIQLAGKQAADADLTAIAALSGTSGFLKKTAANTWSLDTETYLTAASTIDGGTY